MAALGGELSSAPAVTPASAPTPAVIWPRAQDFKEATREFQRSLIRHALAESQGNWAAAARSLGMHRSNFHHLALRLGLKEQT